MSFHGISQGSVSLPVELAHADVPLGRLTRSLSPSRTGLPFHWTEAVRILLEQMTETQARLI